MVAGQENANAGSGDAEPSIRLETPVDIVDAMVPDKLRDKPVAAVLNVTIQSDGRFERSAIWG